MIVISVMIGLTETFPLDIQSSSSCLFPAASQLFFTLTPPLSHIRSRSIHCRQVLERTIDETFPIRYRSMLPCPEDDHYILNTLITLISKPMRDLEPGT